MCSTSCFHLLCTSRLDVVQTSPKLHAFVYSCLLQYEFLGKLMGVVYIDSNQSLPLDFPSLFWKWLVRDEINLNDLKAIDYPTWKTIDLMVRAYVHGKAIHLMKCACMWWRCISTKDVFDQNQPASARHASIYPLSATLSVHRVLQSFTQFDQCPVN